MQYARYTRAAGRSIPDEHEGWSTAPDGRRFYVWKQRCLHDECWAARCECGHKLTAHDFDPAGAHAGALEALGARDPLDRPDFAHPRFQCRRPR